MNQLVYVFPVLSILVTVDERWKDDRYRKKQRLRKALLETSLIVERIEDDGIELR